MNDIFLTIIFPVYNEADRIPRTLKTCLSYFAEKSYSFEIIVVDDGSRDNTVGIVREILEAAGVRFSIIELGRNFGKGRAVKEGLKEAKGDVVFFSDADLSTPIHELDRMLPFFDEGWDIVIGSRAVRGSDIRVRQPWYRQLAGQIFNVMVRMIILPGIMDTQCGFKGFSRKTIDVITSRQQLEGFAFDVEILWIARNAGFSIKEEPVTWLNDKNTKVGLFKDSLKMFIDIFKVRFARRSPVDK